MLLSILHCPFSSLLIFWFISFDLQFLASHCCIFTELLGALIFQLMFKFSVPVLPEATVFHLSIENSPWLKNLKRKLQWKRFAARWTQTWPLISFQEESWQQPASGREKGRGCPGKLLPPSETVDLKSVIHSFVFSPFYCLLLYWECRGTGAWHRHICFILMWHWF